MTLFDIFVRAIALAEDREGVLGDDEIVFPPEPDFGYESTPRNALTFGAMGVDGVHYAILKIDGAVTDESPVIHVSPMYFSEPYAVLGESFLAYLAAVCGVAHSEMEAVFAAERSSGAKLVPFLKAHFKHSRLYNEMRLRSLDSYLKLIETKPCRMTRGELLAHSISFALLSARKVVHGLHQGLTEEERRAVANAVVDELKRSNGDQWRLDEEIESPITRAHSTSVKR